MPDFSVILQDPGIRNIVQENILERAFHDALFPRMLFRGEATPQIWAANTGDTQLFTGVGLVKPSMKPLTPGQDPAVSDYQKEQWSAQMQKYSGAIDSHMPTVIAAIANLFYRNSQQMGLQSAQTLNRLVRDKLYNAALSGNTVADGVQVATATLAVKRLNGFTRARNPNLVGGSNVRFDFVSASNPLTITAGASTRSVIGFTPTTLGDEIGPGTLTLSAVVTVADRDPVLAVDKSFIVRVGGGATIDALTGASLFSLQAIRNAVSRLRQQNVPPHADQRYHCHLDPTQENQAFADPEFQRLMTSLPDYFMYRDLALGEIQGCAFLRNSENPQVDTVGNKVSTFPTPFDQDDFFAGELVNATSVKVHRALFTGEDAIFEYYQDLSMQITEAGVTGRTGVSTITNNGIEVHTDRIALYIRAPLNRIQDQVSTAWAFGGDWPVRTDATTGDAARYKRIATVESGEA